MKIFLASSREALGHLHEIQDWLVKAGHEPFAWDNPTVFPAGQYTLQRLVYLSGLVEAAMFIFREDDKVWYRGEESGQPRDNVLIEYGLFAGALGHEKAAICSSGNPRIPSDLHGITQVRIQNEADTKAQINAWLGYIRTLECNKIRTTGQVCYEDMEILESNHNQTELSDIDHSDLNYLFLSVVDPIKTRDIIRVVVNDLPDTDLWGEVNPSSFRLCGMYDLMGKWDVLVRFRLSPIHIKPDRIAELITKTLIKEKMIVKKKGSPFNSSDLYNVQKELRFIDSNQHEGDIARVRLGKTTDYEAKRCQRAYLWIEMPGDEHRADILFDSLREGIRKSEVGNIIEAICLSEKAIIIETFMRCSQTNMMSILNRAVEEFIPAYSLQKFTLYCFNYDESPIEHRGVDITS